MMKFTGIDMTTFICTQEEIESGQFSLEALKKMTVDNNCMVVVRKHAIIKNGEVEYLQ